MFGPPIGRPALYGEYGGLKEECEIDQIEDTKTNLDMFGDIQTAIRAPSYCEVVNVTSKPWYNSLSGGFETKTFYRDHQAVHHRHHLIEDKHAGRM